MQLDPLGRHGAPSRLCRRRVGRQGGVGRPFGFVSVATGYQSERGVQTHTLGVAVGQESAGAAGMESSADM
jgi:hypothetical protein